jgi:DNA-binding transcriptional LysR family regulator
MRRYTLRQLDTFLEVARQLSISRAAVALHISQPAVSMQLRQLEDIVGMPLYEQIGRKIQLTDAGHEAAHHAMAAIAELRQLEDAMAARRGIRKGRVELAMVSTAKYFVPMLLVLFRKKFPDIEVSLQIHNRESIMQLLARNEVDLVIMGRAPIPSIASPARSRPIRWASSARRATPCRGAAMRRWRSSTARNSWCARTARGRGRQWSACSASTASTPGW